MVDCVRIERLAACAVQPRMSERVKAKARYRMLRVGERIRRGDEVNGCQVWIPVLWSIGCLVGPEGVGFYRRPITRTRRAR